MKNIKTERLILRAPREADAEALLAIRNSAFVLRFNPMRVWTVADMLTQIQGEMENGNALYIERRADGALLGGIWLEEDELRYCVASRCVSYYLGEQYARQGYMKEALAAVLSAAFRQNPSLEVIAARVLSGNTASEQLLRALGFTYEGCLRRCVRDVQNVVHDDQLFSILNTEIK